MGLNYIDSYMVWCRLGVAATSSRGVHCLIADKDWDCRLLGPE